LKAGGADAPTRNRIETERQALRQKTLALSDLVAVFRALD
jgi:hypothetical protein